MKNLTGKHAVLTGAGSGIGEALALGLAREGCSLYLNDINPDRLDTVMERCRSLHPDIIVAGEIFDVSVEENMHRFAQHAIETLGHVDIMINNAGVALGYVKAEDIKKKDFDWIMGINFWGMVYGTQAMVPHLKGRPESALVNISSLFGLVGIAYQAAYCSTKFAIRGYTESLRMEVLHDAPHLTIHSVHPGGVSTKIADDSRWVADETRPDNDDINKLLVMPPAKAADIIINGIKHKKHKIIVGKDAKQGDWIQRIWPEKYTKIIWKQLSKATDMNNII